MGWQRALKTWGYAWEHLRKRGTETSKAEFAIYLRLHLNFSHRSSTWSTLTAFTSILITLTPSTLTVSTLLQAACYHQVICYIYLLQNGNQTKMCTYREWTCPRTQYGTILGTTVEKCSSRRGKKPHSARQNNTFREDAGENCERCFRLYGSDYYSDSNHSLQSLNWGTCYTYEAGGLGGPY